MDNSGVKGENGILQISRMQATNASCSNLPILRLRGGGADHKRKEARKRKFGQETGGPQPQPVAEMGPQGLGLETPPMKKQKRTKPPPQSSDLASVTGPEQVTDGERTDRYSGVQSVPPKSQRFIVFIGIQGKLSTIDH